MKNILILSIKLYRLILSPLIGSSCRFYPTCSQYALLVLEQYPWTTSIYLIMKRIFSCHPLHSGGVQFPPKPPLASLLNKPE